MTRKISMIISFTENNLHCTLQKQPQATKKKIDRIKHKNNSKPHRCCLNQKKIIERKVLALAIVQLFYKSSTRLFIYIRIFFRFCSTICLIYFLFGAEQKSAHT